MSSSNTNQRINKRNITPRKSRMELLSTSNKKIFEQISVRKTLQRICGMDGRIWDSKLSILPCIHWFNINIWINSVRNPETGWKAPVLWASENPVTSKLVGKDKTFCYDNINSQQVPHTIRRETPTSQFLSEEWRCWTTHLVPWLFSLLHKDADLYLLSWTANGSVIH